MKPHKWAKEIKAWADGAEIEYRYNEDVWAPAYNPSWCENTEYRIKPQPKENKYAHIPYWLCCGSLNPHHHNSICSEAKAGYPERCRFGTVEEHQKRMEKPKEPQYLYVFDNGFDKYFTPVRCGGVIRSDNPKSTYKCIGKIKLEVDE